MLGAICGDIIGSRHEFAPIKTKDFDLVVPGCRFTDDTVLTCAVAAALTGVPASEILGREDLSESDELGEGYESVFGDYMSDFAHVWMNAGFGTDFMIWAMKRRSERYPYNSAGNGGAMRVAPVAYWGRDLQEVVDLAIKASFPTHSHPEGLKGAVAVAVATRLAEDGEPKEEIKRGVEVACGYDLSRTVAAIREGYGFEVLASQSVPEALICFLESEDWEDAVRNAVSLGGDADTQAAIAGAVAEAYYGGVPKEIADEATVYLDPKLKKVAKDFRGECDRRDSVSVSGAVDRLERLPWKSSGKPGKRASGAARPDAPDAAKFGSAPASTRRKSLMARLLFRR